MSPGGVNIVDVWYFVPVRTVVHQKHPTGLCEHCGEEESVEHVICVCQKYTNEREIMKNELRKMGVDKLKLKNIVTRGLESLFLYLKRTELFFMERVNAGPHSNTVGGDNAP